MTVLTGEQIFYGLAPAERAALVGELAVQSGYIRTFAPEYAEANEDGSVRLIWVDGLYPPWDLEFDDSFRRIFHDQNAVREEAKRNFRRNLREYSAERLWRGDVNDFCFGFAVLANRGVTVKTIAAQLRKMERINIECAEEHDAAMEEIMRRLIVYGYGNYTGYSASCAVWFSDKEIAATAKQIQNAKKAPKGRPDIAQMLCQKSTLGAAFFLPCCF